MKPRLWRTCLALLGYALTTSAGLAHSGHEHGIGAVHVMLSPEHLLGFAGIGAAAGALMLVRHISTIIVANGLLLLFLATQAAAHAKSDGILFGIEVAVAGAILAMGGWRAVGLCYVQFLAWKRGSGP